MNYLKTNLSRPLLLLFIFVSCINTSAQTGLPDTWPADMVLTITYGGGMRDFTSHLEIKQTGSFYETKGEEGHTKKGLSFTQTQLDELLGLLRSNEFNRIRSDLRKGIVYDMGTTTITLTWGAQHLSVSTGSSTEIPEIYKEQYQVIDSYIDKLLANRL